MKSINSLLLIISLSIVSLLTAQNPVVSVKTVSSDQKLKKDSHSYEVDPKYAHRLYKQSNANGLEAGFPIDYDQEDRDYAQSIGSSMLEFVWKLNENYTHNDTFSLTRAMVYFDTIPNGYPGNDEFVSVRNTSLKIDSIDIWINHQMSGALKNVIKVKILDNGSDTIIGKNVVGTVLWSENFIAKKSITPPGVVSPITVYPNLTLDTGQTFIVKVDFSGSINDNFELFASERDDCFGTCLSEPSIIFGNSLFYLNFISSSGTDLSGFNYIVADCDMNGTGGTPGSCEWFGPQNFLIIPYVSKGFPTGISPIIDKSISVYPNPAFDQIYIESIANLKSVSVSIFDVQGVEVLSDPVIDATKIDVSNLSNGVYTLVLNSGFNVSAVRFIVAR
ncbi:MAG: T9SS type A sorting domain-containing protein [Bacteroidia bacterium]|nr:T9SS type A sorting domain-containing protein [Bacteroidia bacterium]